ncbi:hypothetical protein RRG08_024475 [Elysia crispata]|uniref:Uncharacterized protein n=1 Tax=Elysia crispata TaxID=231223 RepID=A0AAE0YPG7_9GAST|nr:hypothetical protein RRG08_024475 [Elysia crispata]
MHERNQMFKANIPKTAEFPQINGDDWLLICQPSQRLQGDLEMNKRRCWPLLFLKGMENWRLKKALGRKKGGRVLKEGNGGSKAHHGSVDPEDAFLQGRGDYRSRPIPAIGVEHVMLKTATTQGAPDVDDLSDSGGGGARDIQDERGRQIEDEIERT